MQKNRGGEQWGRIGLLLYKDIPITVTQADNIEDYICITDIAAAKSDNLRAADVIKNWMRNRNTLEFLGTWESIYNGDFKVVEFDPMASTSFGMR